MSPQQSLKKSEKEMIKQVLLKARPFAFSCSARCVVIYSIYIHLFTVFSILRICMYFVRTRLF